MRCALPPHLPAPHALLPALQNVGSLNFPLVLFDSLAGARIFRAVAALLHMHFCKPPSSRVVSRSLLLLFYSFAGCACTIALLPAIHTSRWRAAFVAVCCLPALLFCGAGLPLLLLPRCCRRAAAATAIAAAAAATAAAAAAAGWALVDQTPAHGRLPPPYRLNSPHAFRPHRLRRPNAWSGASRSC